MECSLEYLNLPAALKARIRQVKLPTTLQTRNTQPSFVLYVPTVVLRLEHNPGFALACHLANHHHIPLVVLAVVVDDQHLPTHRRPSSTNAADASSKPSPAVVMTSRRLAFILEALQQASWDWHEHGAAVLLRLHGPQARKPHHLTLARHSLAVVTDEPFVHPHLALVESIEQAAICPVYRVDGSTVVPPASILASHKKSKLPKKAWLWENMTQARRKDHVMATVRDGHLDAPVLQVRLDAKSLLTQPQEEESNNWSSILPSEWLSLTTPAPGIRPWTAHDLANLVNLKQWCCEWPGADASVPPCRQTHGAAASARWKSFCQHSLATYARRRNQVQHPHAVSRMSCYLNYGTISMFEIISDIWKFPSITAKFQDEILKWREMSYAHALVHPTEYDTAQSVPAWACRYFESCRSNSRGDATVLPLSQLEQGSTTDPKWNAMQHYLVQTGELHNHARMTWGKTVVHWQKTRYTVGEILNQLCYLNDRYALDGLAPPSYAGILWCFGWADKPSADGTSVSEKPAWRYRVGPEGFQQASRDLLMNKSRDQPSIVAALSRQSAKKRKPNDQEEQEPFTPTPRSKPKANASANTLFAYFSPQPKEEGRTRADT